MLEPPLSVPCRVVTEERADEYRTDEFGELVVDAPELPFRIEVDLPSGDMRDAVDHGLTITQRGNRPGHRSRCVFDSRSDNEVRAAVGDHGVLTTVPRPG